MGKVNAKELIRSAKLPERSVPVCLQADLVAEHEAAERELEQARERPAKSLDSGSRIRELSEQLAALEEQMAEHTIGFRLRAMARPVWKAFVAEHPPRKVEETGDPDERDKYIGVNVETFFPELIRRSVVEPELDGEDWALLLDEKLTDRQFDDLSDAAWALNRRDVDVPFSRAASRIRSSEPE